MDGMMEDHLQLINVEMYLIDGTTRFMKLMDVTLVDII